MVENPDQVSQGIAAAAIDAVALPVTSLLITLDAARQDRSIHVRMG